MRVLALSYLIAFSKIVSEEINKDYLISKSLFTNYLSGKDVCCKAFGYSKNKLQNILFSHSHIKAMTIVNSKSK